MTSKLQTKKPNKFHLTDLPFDSLLDITSFFGKPREIFNFISICKLLNGMQFSKEYYTRLCPNVTFFLSKEEFRKIESNRIIPYVLKINAGLFPSFGKSKSRMNNIFGANEDLQLIARVFSNLKELNIRNWKRITDEGLKNFEGRNIHCIDLYGCNEITDLGLKYLRGIKDIHLPGCNKITNEGMKFLEEVKIINISNEKHITGKGLKNLKKLRTLSLNCKTFTDKGLIYFKGKRFESIFLGWNSNITDEGLKYLKNCKYIRIHQHFTRFNNLKITNKGLKYLKDCERIDLFHCNDISDKGLEYFEKIEILYLFSIHNVSDKGLKYLKNCKFLKLVDCPRITDEGIKYLKRNNPHIIIKDT